MSAMFTASNGLEVCEENGLRVEPRSLGGLDLGRQASAAVREFIEQERDAELGRWRWPENPRYVVYATEGTDEVRVIDERSGSTCLIRRSASKGTSDHFVGAAAAYFETHPEPAPLPSEPHSAWVDKFGTDIWWVNAAGVLRCCASPGSDPAKYAPFTRLVPEVKP